MSNTIGSQIRITLILVVAGLTLTAWLLTYYQYRQMGLLMQAGVPMSLEMPGVATLISFGLFTGMWLVMMVAMMLPATYPMLLLHRTVCRKRSGEGRSPTLVFALSYFLTWTAAGALFFCAYLGISYFTSVAAHGDLRILRSAGVALLASGVYQFSPAKFACLKYCQNPLHFVQHHWRDGRIGAAHMGVVHGLYCFGCCWGLMLILFFMGLMNLGWMALLSAIILVERIVPRRQIVARVAGAVFILIGVVVVIWPVLLLRLS
jgi:predicted metal-binding membrane protein